MIVPTDMSGLIMLRYISHALTLMGVPLIGLRMAPFMVIVTPELHEGGIRSLRLDCVPVGLWH